MIEQHFLELRSSPWHIWCNLSLLASSEPLPGAASTALLPQGQCWACPRECRAVPRQHPPGATHPGGCTSLGLELCVPCQGTALVHEARSEVSTFQEIRIIHGAVATPTHGCLGFQQDSPVPSVYGSCSHIPCRVPVISLASVFKKLWKM